MLSDRVGIHHEFARLFLLGSWGTTEGYSNKAKKGAKKDRSLRN